MNQPSLPDLPLKSLSHLPVWAILMPNNSSRKAGTRSRCHCVAGPYLAGVNAHVDSRAVSLLTLHPFNVDDVLLSIHLDYLANLLTFVVSSNHLRENTKLNSPHCKCLNITVRKLMIRNIQANNETFCTKNRLILAVKFSLLHTPPFPPPYKSALGYSKSGGGSSPGFFPSLT